MSQKVLLSHARHRFQACGGIVFGFPFRLLREIRGGVVLFIDPGVTVLLLRWIERRLLLWLIYRGLLRWVVGLLIRGVLLRIGDWLLYRGETSWLLIHLRVGDLLWIALIGVGLGLV